MPTVPSHQPVVPSRQPVAPGPEDVPAAAPATDRLGAVWQQDRAALGVWSSLADPVVAEALGHGPFDYACIDLQHGHATMADLGGLVRAVRAGGCSAAVRVPWNEPQAIMRALDLGAATIIVPMVETAAAARAAADACRYPPRGTRSWGPMWADVRPPGPNDGPAAANDTVRCLVMVETRTAVANIEEIVRVEGVDGVYVGPNDLALSTGHGRASYRDSAAVADLLDHLVTTCRDHGLVAGVHCSDPAMAADWAERGARLLTATSDTALLRAGLDWAGTELDRLREAPSDVEPGV